MENQEDILERAERLRDILRREGWTDYSYYCYQSPDYGPNAGTLIADYGYPDGIRIYISKSKVAQDGKFICQIETEDQLNKFLDFLKSLRI